MISKYARLTRAHTAPLEAVPAIVGGLLATGGSITIGVIAWGVFGILYHLTGYGMNSYVDWKNGFDRDDPHKEHHPLNTGEIKELDGIIFIWLVAIITAALAIYLSLSSYIALGLIVAMVFFGSLYNYIGKITTLKFIPISIAHSLVFVIPYIAMGGEINRLFLLLTLYIFLWVVFQISVSGEFKDIRNWGEANFMRRLGLSTYGPPYGLILKAATLILIIYLAYNHGRPVAVVPISMLCYYVTIEVMYTPPSHRDYIIKLISVIEGLMVFALLFSVSDVISLNMAIVLSLGSIAWVVTFNKIEWDTLLSPKV